MPFTTDQEKYLKNLFETGAAPYEATDGDIISANRIKRVYTENPTLQVNLTLRNFRSLYRRRAAEFLTEKTVSGTRRTQTTRATPGTGKLLLLLVTVFL